MYLVCVDSNAVHGDPLLQNEHLGQRLLALVADGQCQLHLSPVVTAELSRQVLEKLKTDHQSLRTRIVSLGKQYGDSAALLAKLDNFAEAGEALIGKRYATLVAGGGVFIQDWPETSVQAMVEREIKRRRPFMKKEPGTIGHRDTVIWLNVLELARAHPGDTVLFVTADKGFKSSAKLLHGDLLADMAEQLIPPERIRIFAELYPALEFLEALKADTPAGQKADQIDLASWRAAVTQALLNYNDELKNMDWWPVDDIRDGGYSEPDYEIGIPYAFEDPSISYIDGPFEVFIDADEPVFDRPVTCTHQVTISFSGTMAKSEYYVEDQDEIDLWDGDLNDYTVGVEADRTIKLTTIVLYDSEADEAEVQSLERVTRVR
jgi:hypothetical protein